MATAFGIQLIFIFGSIQPGLIHMDLSRGGGLPWIKLFSNFDAYASFVGLKVLQTVFWVNWIGLIGRLGSKSRVQGIL